MLSGYGLDRSSTYECTWVRSRMGIPTASVSAAAVEIALAAVTAVPPRKRRAGASGCSIEE